MPSLDFDTGPEADALLTALIMDRERLHERGRDGAAQTAANLATRVRNAIRDGGE